ncbi:MAG: hypothetical protein ABIW34_05930 [Ginsengibacter sp.]
MIFELLPTIDIMFDLYEKPRTIERFQQYLKILQGDTKGDLAMPISGFNPMAKEHILQKLTELKSLNTEQVVQETLFDLNNKLTNQPNDKIYKVALNLSDDLKGGWTNHFTTDYESKFKINAIVNRNFCTPLFWTSEHFTIELIKKRTLQYAYRTIYWLTNPKPKTLKDHVEQERFVSKNVDITTAIKQILDLNIIDTFYKQHQDTDNYHIIFNFFYGDSASKSLEFPCFGVSGQITGYEYSTLVDCERKTTA